MSCVQMPHGSIVELDDDGRPRQWRAPDGAVIAEIGAASVQLTLPGLHERPMTVGADLEEHAVLGAVHPIRAGDDPAVLARVASTTWRSPAHIPAIDAPGRVPAGAGSVLLNVLAIAAQTAERTLRYAGPYPTAALWASLRECFRADAADEARFTDGALDRALRGDTSEVPVDFAPAPFERVQIAPRAVVHLREGVERLYLGGLAWGRSGARRLTVDGDVVRVALWLGGSPWAEVATLGLDGMLRTGPRPLPTVRSTVLGKPFPPSLSGALGDLLCADEPPLLEAAMREVLREVPIMWGDPGADAARALGGAIVVHAALWDRLGAGPGADLAIALGEALLGPVKQIAQQRLETVPIGTAVH